MSREPIIVDGVDVLGCEWIREVGLDSEYICTCNSPNKTSGYCKYNPNCRYKELKRKEQECERLKHDNGYEVGALEKTIDNLKAENEILEKDKANLDVIIETLKAQFKQLKEEKDLLQQECENWERQVFFADEQINEMQDEINLLQQYKKSSETLLAEQIEIKKYLGISHKTILERLEELTDFRDKDRELIDQLEKENIKLKELVKTRIEDLCDSCGASSMMPMPCKVYEQALQEIKELCNKSVINGKTFDDYETLGASNIAQDILQIIENKENE